MQIAFYVQSLFVYFLDICRNICKKADLYSKERKNMEEGRRRRFGGGRGRFPPKPVKEGDEVELTIEAVGAKGDGIGKIEGFVVFVPNAQAGEKVKVRITQVRGRSAVGEKI
jgi:predicted RNA-binding protein with TRAM domain